MRRSKLEMYVDILSVLANRGPLKLTHIMYKANVNCSVLEGLLDFLIKQGLVEKRYLTKSYIPSRERRIAERLTSQSSISATAMNRIVSAWTEAGFLTNDFVQKDDYSQLLKNELLCSNPIKIAFRQEVVEEPEKKCVFAITQRGVTVLKYFEALKQGTPIVDEARSLSFSKDVYKRSDKDNNNK
jgi:hypothetical protein